MKFYVIWLACIFTASSLFGMERLMFVDEIDGFLLDSDAFNQFEKTEKTLLFKAVEDKDINKVKELLADPANASMINQRCHPKGWREDILFPPLGYALEKKQWDIVTELINHGADVNFHYGVESYTPLHRHGIPYELLKLIIGKGGNLKAFNNHCVTPFGLIISSGFSLLDQKDFYNKALLFIHNGASILDLIGKKIAIDNLYTISQYGSDKTIAQRFVFEAFKWALANNHKDHLKELCNHNSPAIKEGINYQDKKSDGNTLLHLVAMSEPKKLRNAKALLLLKAGADPNIENKAGLTPLQIAMKQDDKPLFGLLMAYKANIAIPFPAPEDQLNCCSSSINKPRFWGLITKATQGKKVTAQAIEKHDWQYLKQLIEQGENGLRYSADEKDIDGNSLLHYVAAAKRTDDVQKDDKIHISMINFLCKHGAPVNEQNNAGLTPLHVAINNDNNAVAAELLAHGADLMIPHKEKGGTTPFEDAVGRNNQEFLQIITHPSQGDEAERPAKRARIF